MLMGASAPAILAADGGSDRLPGMATIADADVDGIVADIERSAELAAERLATLRSDRLQREAVIEQVGADPVALRDWVAENTAWVPYEGALRGADGVLLDRTGNSLDRSLLLAALLRDAGYTANLANRELTPDDAATVLSDAAARDRGDEITPELASPDEIEGYRDAVTRSSNALADALDEAGATSAASGSALAAAADHWWVQTQADGATIDLDPSGAVAEAGTDEAYVSLDPADLPDELRHSVTVRVVGERTQDGAITPFEPFEYTLRLGSGEPLPSFELAFDSTIADPPEGELDIDGMAAAISHWRPTLSGAGLDLVGDWFTTDGRLEIPAAAPTRDIFGDATDALGGLDSDDDDGGAPGALTALWLEYETSGPGLETRVERRDLLRDPDPTSTDVAAALLGGTDILVQTSSVDPIAFERMLLQDIVDVRSALIALTYMAAGREDDRILPSLASADLEPSNLWALALARGRWGSDPGAVFIGRPNVWTEHETYTPTGDGLVQGSAVDIVHNDVEVVPAAADRAAQIRLEQGILDTLAEQALIENPGPDNTWARFDAAIGAGAGWVSYSDPLELTEALAALPEDDVQRMRAAIEAGDVVITDPVPADGIVSWWRIDPNDGSTLGIGPKGWGTVGERVGVHQVPAAVLRTFIRTQGGGTGTAGRNLAAQAARYASNTPVPATGTRTVFELVGGVIQRIYIL
jgi:hypothetical protein